MTLTNFLSQWQQDAIADAYGKASRFDKVAELADAAPLLKGPAEQEALSVRVHAGSNPALVTEIAWCPACETRETRKAFTPYCSQLCLEAAKRNELMDRR